MSKELKLDAGPNSRPQGRPSWAQGEIRDGIEDLQLAIGLRYQALANKRVDVVNGYSTDGMIAAMKLKRLKDDKGSGAVFHGPVVRKDALVQQKIAMLNQVSALLTEQHGRRTTGRWRKMGKGRARDLKSRA